MYAEQKHIYEDFFCVFCESVDDKVTMKSFYNHYLQNKKKNSECGKVENKNISIERFYSFDRKIGISFQIYTFQHLFSPGKVR